MRVCRVKPDMNVCCTCIDEQIDNNIQKDCAGCNIDPHYYEIIQLGVTIFGKPYAMVLHDGIIQKVSLDRLYDVKEALEL